MSRLRRIALTVAAMLIVLLLVASFRFVQSRGVFASVVEKTPGVCRTMAGLTGVIAILPDESAHSAILATRQGGIFVWTGGAATKLSGTPKDFQPVALTASNGKLDAAFTHQDGSYAIASFDVAPGKVTETNRLTTDQLTDPAALAALPEGRFYLVNHHSSLTAFGRWLDDTFLIPRAEVLFFDGMKFVTVAKRLNAPSSVALSADGSVLYVAQELPHTLASFKRNDFTGALGEVQLINLPAAPTKITLAKDGSLIVAAWPKRGQGAVYRVRADGGAELLYAAKNGEITAAAELNGQLLVGTDKAFLACALH